MLTFFDNNKERKSNRMTLDRQAVLVILRFEEDDNSGEQKI